MFLILCATTCVLCNIVENILKQETLIKEYFSETPRFQDSNLGLQKHLSFHDPYFTSLDDADKEHENSPNRCMVTVRLAMRPLSRSSVAGDLSSARGPPQGRGAQRWERPRQTHPVGTILVSRATKITSMDYFRPPDLPKCFLPRPISIPRRTNLPSLSHETRGNVNENVRTPIRNPIP